MDIRDFIWKNFQQWKPQNPEWLTCDSYQKSGEEIRRIFHTISQIIDREEIYLASFFLPFRISLALKSNEDNKEMEIRDQFLSLTLMQT